METALLVGRLLLAAVFAGAGVAKLVDRAGSRNALVGFGVPSTLVTPLAILLPLAEIVVAVALVPLNTAWFGAIGALTLLLVFVAGIGYNLARGRTPDCHCFGQLHSAPAGWPTLARNAVLTALAGMLVWQGPETVGASAVAWMGNLTAGQVIASVFGLLLLGAVAAQAWFMLNLLQQNGRLMLRIEALEAKMTGTVPAAPAPAPQPVAGLPVGAKVPGFKLSGLYGETLTLDALRAADKPVMLVFSDPGCGPCNALSPDVAKWQREYGSKLTIATISRGTVEVNRAKSTEHGLTHVLLQEDREVAQAYEVYGTPGAVLINPDGTIGSPLALGADAIRRLVEQTVMVPSPGQAAVVPTNGKACDCGKHKANCDCARQNRNQQQAAPVRSAGLKIGDAAPAIKLPDLVGKTVELANFKGTNTLVLFWNPGCGFCSRMLDELKAWEANPPKGAPKLLLVSTGSVEVNHAMGLRSTVVLDENFSVGRAFGATGTPSAVLVDGKGRIASEITVGAPAVLALARAQHQPQTATTSTS